MTTLKQLTDFLDALLEPDKFPGDLSNNGLQIEASETVGKALFAVDASLELINIAAERKADFIFVHHGISWGDGLKRLTGFNAGRVGALFRRGISLYAVHLPLDAHPIVGHNAILAKTIGIEGAVPFGQYHGAEIGYAGTLPKPTPLRDIANTLQSSLGGIPKIFGDPGVNVTRVGVVSGGAGDMAPQAAAAGLDAYITGEVSHQNIHHIAESGVPVLALGHYASEKPGVLTVMEMVADKLDITCEFIDLPTGL